MRNAMDIIETRHAYVVMRWQSKFGEASYYC